MRWQVQEAKQKFSALVQHALDDGPQIVTRRGEEVVVVLSASDYRRLTRPRPDFAEFLLAAPDLSQLEIERTDDPARAVEL
jgi:prevent-host-death family protein